MELKSTALIREVSCLLPYGYSATVTAADAAPNSNPLIATLKPQSNEPSYTNTVIGTLPVDGWPVTFGKARRGMGGPQPGGPQPVPSLLYTKCKSPPVNGQCTNFVLFDVAL